MHWSVSGLAVWCGGRTGERAVPRGAGVHERLRVEVGDGEGLDGLLAGAEGLGRGVWEEGRGVLEVESGEGIECRRGYAHGEAEELHEAHNSRARVANKEKKDERESGHHQPSSSLGNEGGGDVRGESVCEIAWRTGVSWLAGSAARILCIAAPLLGGREER
jgi:hypothetical protein